MTAQGQHPTNSPDSLTSPQPSASLTARVAWLAATIAFGGGLAGSCAAGESAGGAGGDGGGAAGTGGITMTGGSTGTAGAGGTSCQSPPAIKATWSIVINGTSTSETCAQAGATKVQVLIDGVTYSFDCAAMTGTTPTITSGSHNLLFALSGDSGLLSSGTTTANVPTCGTLAFTIPFKVAAPSASGGSTGSGGGGGGGGGGSGGGGGKGGTGGTGGTFMPGTGPCDALPIFALHQCAYPGACHDSKGTSAALDMSTTGWQNSLVGRLPKAGGTITSSCIGTGGVYLKAGSNPATGLFLDKVNPGMQKCGNRMPLTGDYLTPAELDCVQRWANGLTK